MNVRFLWAGLLVGMALVAAAPAQDVDAEEERDAIEKRREWFLGIRGLLDPEADIEAARRIRLMAAIDTAERSRAAGRSPWGGAWRGIGPAPIAPPNWAGRTSHLAFDPGSTSTLYLSVSQGGMWKTTDGGATWVSLTESVPSQSVGVTALAPGNPNEIWLGTGDYNTYWTGYLSAGIYRSTDGGSTWTARNGSGATAMPLSTIASISIHPSVPTDIVVGGGSIGQGSGGQGGIWRTTDAGSTWTRVFDKRARQILRDPGNPSVLLAARRGDATNPTNIGVIRSTDGGASWSDFANGITATSRGQFVLARAPSDPLVLYYWDSGWDGSGTNDLFRSTDGAATWTRVYPAFPARTWGACLAVDPTDPGVLYAGELGAHVSTDGGATFAGTAAFTHVDHQSVDINAAEPGAVYWGTDGGLYKKVGPTGNFNLNGNLSITEMYDVGIHPTDDDIVMMGSQDNGEALYTGSTVWTRVGPIADGMRTTIDPVDTRFCYITIQPDGAGAPRLYRSAGGPSGSYTLISGSITDQAFWETPFVLDPADHRTIYLGTSRLQRSTDQGATWAPASPDWAPALVLDIAVAPSNRDVIYVTNAQTVYRTTDRGATWTDLQLGTGANLNDIAVDAADPDHAIVALAKFNATTLYATTDGGATWTGVTNGLPPVPAMSVAILSDPYRVYVGTDVGVFVAPSDAGPFVPDMAGLVQGVPVVDIEYNATTGTITAATAGRGAYQKSAIASFDVTVGKGAGTGASYDSRVNAYRSDGTTISQIDFAAYATGDRGVNTTGADLTGDGWGEIVTGQGPGSGNPPVGKAFDATGVPLANASWAAYGGTGYGLNVASGGIDGDTYDEVLTGPGEGAVYGPQVRAWNYDGAGAVTAIAKINYYAYGTLKYGVNVAAGSPDADDYAEIVTGAGPGDVFGPHVRGWQYDGVGVAAMAKVSFFAYSTLKFGVNAGAGDVERDGYDEILTAPGPGAVFGAQVRGFDVDGGSATAIAKINFVAYASYRYGANVASGDVDGDRYAELCTGPGPDPAASAELKGFDYDGSAVTPIPAMTVDVWPGLTYGLTAAVGRHGY